MRSPAFPIRPVGLPVCASALAAALVLGGWHDPRSAAAAQVSTAPDREPVQPSLDEARGNALVDAGQLQEGADALARAERDYAQRGDGTGQARVALRRSTTLRRLARFDEAVSSATHALSLADGNAAIEVGALTELGLLANDRGELDEADRSLTRALPLAERVGDAAAESAVLRALARVRESRGQAAEALALLDRAIVAADRSGEVPHRVAGRVLATTQLLALARYDDALARAEEAAALTRDGASPGVRGDALFNLAQAHGHVWNLDRAAELWREAIEAHQQAGNVRTVALAIKQSVDAAFAQGEFDRAAADGGRAVELLRQTRFEWLVPETLARLALTEARRQRLDPARTWAARARAEATTAPLARRPFVYNDLGLVALELGDLTLAQADFMRVRDIAGEIGNVEYEWRAWWGLGRALTAARDWPAAADALERAIAIVEPLRQTIPDAALRATFMTNRVGPYETLVEATLGRSRAPDDPAVRAALHVAERARSRALADLLAEARARPSDPRLQAVREREMAFGRQLSAATRRVAAATDDTARAAALAGLRALEDEYDAFVLQIRRDNAGYAALAHPEPLDAGAIMRMLRPEEALVEFLIAERRGFAWVVRADGVRGHAVPGQDALLPRVRLLQALAAGNDVAALERLGGDLYARLLAPAEAALKDVRRLIIVPDGPLQRVPFALLRVGDRWLVERYAITLSPSATVLEYLRRVPARRGVRPLLALAASEVADGQTAPFDLAPGSLPSLPHTTREIEAARRLAGDGDTYAGPSAIEGVLKAPAAADYRIVHLAAHAIADEAVPRRSAVLLTPGQSDDGLLRVSEIANLSLGADLVVLAACRSHVGRLVRGEGLLSLGRAFLHAGARAVLATSWMVDDRETAWMMSELYRALGEGLAPDEALRHAQRRAIAAGGRHAAPASWGAFLVIGDARTPILDAAPASAARWARPVAIVVLAVATGAWLRRGRGRRAASLQPEARRR
jgi:CHAT domain-containing protein/tetratricopeptide (TPR) repeat protein